MTVDDVFTRMEERLGNVSDISEAQKLAMASELNQSLYLGYSGVSPVKFLASEAYTFSASPSTQSLPVDFQTTGLAGCGVYVMDGSTVSYLLPTTCYGSQDQGYYFEGDDIVFTGFSQSTTVTLKYLPMIDNFTLTTEEFCVPDRYASMVYQGMVAMYYRENENEVREATAWGKFDALYQEFLKTCTQGTTTVLTGSLTNGF